MCSNFQMTCTDKMYPSMQNCQWQQIKYCLIYVFSESPFKQSTFQMKWMLRFRYTPPHLKLSVTGDQVLADLCLQWEPIWNGHGIRSSSQRKWTTRSTCQMKCTLRPDIPPIWNCHWQQIMYWLICRQWEPIWNSHLHNSFTLCHLVLNYWRGKSYIYHLWKWNNLCKFQVFVVVFVVLIISCCCCCVYIVTHGQQNNNKKNENKKIHVNWSFCSDSYSY